MDTPKKNRIQKCSEFALIAVDVASEALAVFEDQPWSAPAQLGLLALKMVILMYLKSAPQQPEPEHAEQEHPEPPSNCSSTVHMSEATAAEITDKSEPDGPTDEQQSHPRES